MDAVTIPLATVSATLAERWGQRVVGAALLLVGATYVWLRGASVTTEEDEDVLDLTDGDPDVSVALAEAG